MLSHKRLSFDQQRQKICMRSVSNVQCTANSFIPFSVHLARRLAGEVPCLTSIPRTAICLQQPALNIARYLKHFVVNPVDLWYKGIVFKRNIFRIFQITCNYVAEMLYLSRPGVNHLMIRHVQADRHYCQCACTWYS